MSKPQSIKIQPWTDYQKQPYSIMSDDFVHDKFLVAKTSLKTERGTVNIKETVSKKENYSFNDQVKLWFTLPKDKTIYTKIKNNYLKLHLDNGVVDVKGKKWNCYGSINTNQSLQDISLKVGIRNISHKCSSDNRLKIWKEGDGQRYTWYHRTMIHQNKHTFGILGVFDISRKLIQKNNLLYGFKYDNKNEFYLRASVKDYRNQPLDFSDAKNYFDILTLNYISKLKNNLTVAAELAYDCPHNKLETLALVLQKKFPEKNLVAKLKVDHLANLAASIKRPVFGLEDIASFIFGFQFQSKNIHNPKYGVQLDINL